MHKIHVQTQKDRNTNTPKHRKFEQALTHFVSTAYTRDSR